MVISRHKTVYWIKNNSVDTSVKDIEGFVEIHFHEFYEIEIILSGGGIYTIDGIDYKIKAGSLFFMSPSSCHTIRFEENTRLINVMFVMDFCEPEFLYDFFERTPHIVLDLADEDIQFLYTVTKEMSVSHSLLYLKAMLNSVLGKIRSVYNLSEPAVNNTAMQYAVLYLQNRFKENVRLSEVAGSVNYSANYFVNKFKAFTGVTFKEYLSNLRFAHAEKLLKYTNLSVTEICYQSGFSDFSNFMSYFKARYGVTPKEFRKSLKNRQHKL